MGPTWISLQMRLIFRKSPKPRPRFFGAPKVQTNEPLFAVEALGFSFGNAVNVVLFVGRALRLFGVFLSKMENYRTFREEEGDLF